uniref:Global transcription factor n=1 Tax=Cucumis melo TaxID=3656 RepID=A0A9I9EBE2_CUCME
MYYVGKASPDRLYRAALLRNQFADTILKAREKHLKMFVKLEIFLVCPMLGQPYDAQTHTLAASYGRRKAEAEVAVVATDGGDGRQRRWKGRRRATDSDRKPRTFPDTLLTASGKPRSFPTHYLPFPTHTYDVKKTYALGIPLISHVRLVPTHYLWRREYPLFSDVLWPTYKLCAGKTSDSRRLTLCVENSFFSRRLTLCVGRTSYSRRLLCRREKSDFL